MTDGIRRREIGTIMTSDDYLKNHMEEGGTGAGIIVCSANTESPHVMHVFEILL